MCTLKKQCFQNAPPIVIAVVRACEIVIALIAAQVVGDAEVGDHQAVVLHSIGAALVLLGVSLMAGAEYLQHHFLENRRQKSYEPDSEPYPFVTRK